MNLRRILQGFTLCLFISLFSSTDMNAQAQLAGINSDGLLQLGANHPFVVDEYVIDLRPLGVSNAADAAEVFEIYRTEGYMSFSYDMNNMTARMQIQTSLMAHGQVSVQDMNQRLKDIKKIKG